MRSVDRGWSHALDVQMDYHKWCSSQMGKIYNLLFFQDTLDAVTKMVPVLHKAPPEIESAAIILQDHLVCTLWQADTMFVTSDMLHVLMQAAHDLPEDVEFDETVLITPCGFCMFEEPIVGDDGTGASTAINGMAWRIVHARDHELTEPGGELQKMLLIYFFVDPDDTHDDYVGMFNERLRAQGVPTSPLTLQHFYPARFGRRFDYENFESANGNTIIGDAIAVFLSMQLLAQQTIGEPITVNPDRATRKRAAKWDGQDRVITLITLRRKSVKKDDHEPAKVEWSRRWVVKGHWHKYWYSSLGVHKYRYLHEYIKGPEDKPLVVTERRVFNFRR